MLYILNKLFRRSWEDITGSSDMPECSNWQPIMDHWLLCRCEGNLSHHWLLTHSVITFASSHTMSEQMIGEAPASSVIPSMKKKFRPNSSLGKNTISITTITNRAKKDFLGSRNCCYIIGMFLHIFDHYPTFHTSSCMSTRPVPQMKKYFLLSCGMLVDHQATKTVATYSTIQYMVWSGQTTPKSYCVFIWSHIQMFLAVTHLRFYRG